MTIKTPATVRPAISPAEKYGKILYLDEWTLSFKLNLCSVFFLTIYLIELLEHHFYN